MPAITPLVSGRVKPGACVPSGTISDESAMPEPYPPPARQPRGMRCWLQDSAPARTWMTAPRRCGGVGPNDPTCLPASIVSAGTRPTAARPGGHIGHGHPVACASGQWTFSALLSSKKLVFPPLTSVPTNLRVMVWPMYEARLVVYSTYLVPLFAAVTTGTVWSTVPDEFRTSRTSLFCACRVLLVTFEFTSTQ